MNVLEERREAVERIRGRERPPEYVTAARGADGAAIRVQTGGGPGAGFADPRDLGEWLDDRLVRTPLTGPAGELLCAIAAAARRDEKHAVDALSGARRLGPWDQYRLFCVLKSWEGFPLPEAGRLLRAIAREWSRLGLAAEPPGEDEVLPVRTVNRAELDAADKRRRSKAGRQVYARPACTPDGW